MSACLFCKIVDKEIPARILVEEPDCLAFADIRPVAPVHALVIPKKHIATLNDLEAADEPLLGRLYTVAQRLAREAGVAEEGWRTVMNCNEAAGQTVFHIHLHVLGGRAMTWPPG